MLYILGAGGKKLDDADKIHPWSYGKSGFWGDSWCVWCVDAGGVILVLDIAIIMEKGLNKWLLAALIFYKGGFYPNFVIELTRRMIKILRIPINPFGTA